MLKNKSKNFIFALMFTMMGLFIVLACSVTKTGKINDAANSITNNDFVNEVTVSPLNWKGNTDTYTDVVDKPSTHFKLTSKAVDSLNKILPNFFNNNDFDKDDSSIIARYSDWPDTTAENDAWPQDVHFYYPVTGTNINDRADIFYSNGSIIPYTAKGKFIVYYNKAKAKYKEGDYTAAKQELGKAMHYLADLCTPVHTGYTGLLDAFNWLPGHNAFESDAKMYDNLTGFTPSYTHRNLHNYSDIGQLVDAVAWTSHNYFQQHCDFNLVYCAYDESKLVVYLQETAQTLATVMYKFAIETGLAYNGMVIQNNIVTGFVLPPNFNGHVTIPNWVTAIGSSAFASQAVRDSLVSVIFESGSQLESIGYSAFADCKYLGWTQINIPASVKTIGGMAFRNCNNLRSIKFDAGSKLETIGWNAFSSCEELESITIPKSVKIIDDGAFYYCLKLNNVIFESGSQLETIRRQAFCRTGLSKITIPANVIEIENEAFWNSASLTSVTFESGSKLTTIGDRAFAGCSSLDYYGYYPVYIPVGVTSIGSYAFSDCTSLRKIFIPNSVTNIGHYAFKNCTSLNDISIPNSVINVGDYVFYGLTSNQTINVMVYYSKPEKWSAIWNSACNARIIWGASTVTDGIFAYKLINNNSSYEIFLRNDLFYSDISKNITIPASFGGIPVTQIADNAFKGGIQVITIPSSVTAIGNDAFAYCSSLTTVNFAAGSKLTTIGNYAFLSCSKLTGLSLPAGVISIGNYAFVYCGFTSITIPGSVTTIGETAFNGCAALTTINVETANKNYSSVSGVLFNKNQTALIRYPAGKQDMSYTIPNSVTTVGNYSFFGCKLNSITIQGNVAYIGDYALNDCTSLMGITVVSGNTKFTSEGNCLIRKNDNTLIKGFINSVIPDYVVTIGDHAFENCSYLMSINIPNGVTSIGEGAFSGCSRLTSIVIPDSVTSIKSWAFYGCIGITQMTIPNSVTTIGMGAVCHWRSNQTIYVPGHPYRPAGWDVSWDDDCAAKIVWKDDVPSLAFYLINNNTEYEVYVGNSLRYGDTSIVIPSTYNGLPVTKIGFIAFYGCTSLTEITIPSTITTIGDSAFTGCSNLTTVIFEEGSRLEIIGKDAFAHCGNLTGVTIPNSVTVINNYAFYYCTNLTDLTFAAQSRLTTIGRFAFGDCVSLTDMVIPSTVTTIYDCAFYNCSGLTSIVISKNVTYIEYNVFSNCNKLTIYSEAAAKLANWDSDWNNSNRPVIWGCTLSADKTYVKSFTKNSASISNPTASNGISAPYRENHIFGGWYTNSSCTGTSYTAAQIASAPNVTYYAKWTPLNIMFKVQFNLNGGTGNFPELTINNGGIVSKPLDKPARDGYTFLYWALQGNGSDEYNWNAPINSDITLVAVWEQNLEQIYTSGLTFTLIDNGTAYEVSKGTAILNGAVVIQGFYNGLPVTKIANSGFSGYSGITSINVPGSVTAIGTNAFAGCNNLNEVIIRTASYRPEDFDVWKILTGITISVEIPAGETIIGENAFRNCAIITKVLIPASVTIIGDSAFDCCYGITTVIFDALSRLETISYCAFYACVNLTEITIPSSVTEIGAYAFFDCISLTLAFEPGSRLETIGNYAFCYCDSIIEITFPSGLKTIGAFAFFYCAGLTEITIPASVDTIGVCAFLGCSNFNKVNIETGSPLIDDAEFIFYGCDIQIF